MRYVFLYADNDNPHALYYYYDGATTPTKYYYCNSRYYDPQTRRFVNSDTEDALHVTPGEFTDKNLFAYCDNNPVMRVDNGGEFWNFVVGGVIGSGIFWGNLWR